MKERKKKKKKKSKPVHHYASLRGRPLVHQHREKALSALVGDNKYKNIKILQTCTLENLGIYKES